MNKILLSGRLTRDAEIRNADSDKKVARCTLAVNRDFKKREKGPELISSESSDLKIVRTFLRSLAKKA